MECFFGFSLLKFYANPNINEKTKSRKRWKFGGWMKTSLITILHGGNEEDWKVLSHEVFFWKKIDLKFLKLKKMIKFLKAMNFIKRNTVTEFQDAPLNPQNLILSTDDFQLKAVNIFMNFQLILSTKQNVKTK